MILKCAIIFEVNRKQQKILDLIFTTPTSASIKFSDIEKLLISLGAEKIEGRGSRVAFVMPNGTKWEHHRPHLTCSRKITPSGRRESTKMKMGDSSYEENIYGRTNRWDFERF